MDSLLFSPELTLFIKVPDLQEGKSKLRAIKTTFPRKHCGATRMSGLSLETSGLCGRSLKNLPMAWTRNLVQQASHRGRQSAERWVGGAGAASLSSARLSRLILAALVRACFLPLFPLLVSLFPCPWWVPHPRTSHAHGHQLEGVLILFLLVKL